MLALIVAGGAKFPGLGSDCPVSARVIAGVPVSDQEDRVLSSTVRTDTASTALGPILIEHQGRVGTAIWRMK